MGTTNENSHCQISKYSQGTRYLKLKTDVECLRAIEIADDAELKR